MNRQQLRDFCCRQRGWELVNTSDLAKVDNLIDQALRDISSDAPDALLPDVEHVVLWPDLTSSSEGFKVSVLGVDQYVLEFANGAPYSGIRATGEWDGIFHIEVKDPAGVWHRRQCQEFWRNGDEFRVSLDRPWQNSTDTAMDWRLHQPHCYTRDDVIQVLGGRSWDSNQQRMVPFNSVLADFHNHTDFQGSSNAPCERLIHEGRFQMPSPSNAPTVAAGASVWAGPVNRGQFRFCYTYCWGRRAEEWQQSPSRDVGVYDPMWESAPSPITTFNSHSLTTDIAITTPMIDFERNFGPPSGPSNQRAARSGWFKRFYVARQTVQPSLNTPHQSLGRPDVETADVFYFLDDLDGNTAGNAWTGSILPTYQRRLPEAHGYWMMRPEPHQDQRFEFDLLVRRRHPQLMKDTDAPQMGPHALKVLITRILYYLARLDQDNVDAEVQRIEYLRQVRAFRRTDSAKAKNLAPPTWDMPTAFKHVGNYTDFNIG